MLVADVQRPHYDMCKAIISCSIQAAGMLIHNGFTGDMQQSNPTCCSVMIAEDKGNMQEA